MKCHYEVLGVEVTCSSDDLKKAYRKLALEWHPDKNLDRLEESKENFQLIQQAYDILSDPQERAWYDRHKDDILRGGAEEAYKDDCLDVYQYFNTSCFKGYNDEGKGFYTVYRQVFEKITSEDKPFMDDDEDMEIPQFGYSDSSYEEVVHNFYAYWQSYCTAKTFSWIDKYDLSEARKSGAGRQVIRAMEKENKKLRDAAKKLRNEEVRELVAFVRKRDKRVQAAKKRMEEMKVEKAKKAEEQRRKQAQERKKALEDYKETEWSSMSQFESHLNELESSLDATFGNTGNSNENDDDDEEEAEDLGDLYCVACEKDFRSEKAFKNHENSKKHKENVLLLKTLMEEEEAMSVLGAGEDNSNQDAQSNSDQEENATSRAMLDELIKNSTKSKKKKKKNKASTVNDDKYVKTLEEIELKMENIQVEDDDNVAQNAVDANAPENNDCSLKSEEIRDVIRESKTQAAKMSNMKSSSSKKKENKTKTQVRKSVSEESDDDETEKPNTLCSTCKRNYSSRNKLFEHLKQTGHAAYKNEGSTSSVTGKKQRKKKL